MSEPLAAPKLQTFEEALTQFFGHSVVCDHATHCPEVGLLRAAHARELETARCHHGWRGSVPENGQQITTPCPACGCRSLFIGSGGGLTCSRVPGRDGSGGCHDPSVEEAIKHKIEAARESGRCAVAQETLTRQILIARGELTKDECQKWLERCAGQTS